MNAPVSQELLAPASVEFKLNDLTVVGFEGESILNAAKRHGIHIPHLCYKEGLRADGNCRACVVEIKGERTLAPSCCRNVTPGLEVLADSLRAKQSQKMVLELLQSDMPSTAYTLNNELDQWSLALALGKPRYEPRAKVQQDATHAAITVNLDACIQCNRCVRACDEVQGQMVLSMHGRGFAARIIKGLDTTFEDSPCVSCGACSQALPDRVDPHGGEQAERQDQRIDACHGVPLELRIPTQACT